MANDKDPLLGALGICRKAGKLLHGYDRVEEAVMRGKACLVLLACDASKRTTQQLFRGFMHSLGERTEGNDFNKGALDCALGIVNRDERYLGIYEFCVWYYKLLKKEGLIDEGPVRES